MILDELNTFIDNDTLAITTSTVALGDVIANGDGGLIAEPVYLVVVINDAPTTSGTATFKLMTHSTSTVTSGTVVASIEVANTDIKDGAVFTKAIASEKLNKYIGAAVVGSANSSASGKVTVGIAHDVTKWEATKDGI